MVGIATYLGTDTTHWPGDAAHFKLEPPIDNVSHIMICDLSSLSGIVIPGVPAHIVKTTMSSTTAHSAEVFPVDENGVYAGGDNLVALFWFDGIHTHKDVLLHLGYESD